SEGGLAVALAECCFNPEGQLGAQINITPAANLPASTQPNLKTCATLFAEAQSRIIISVRPEHLAAVIKTLAGAKVPHQQLGTVADSDLKITIGEDEFCWPIP